MRSNVKGAMCSISGANYEKQIHNIISKCTFYGVPFNTQKECDLAGSSSKNDLVCLQNVGIEVKKWNTPDWMQCTLKYNQGWNVVDGKNPSGCQKVFKELLQGVNLYNGHIPPFVNTPITHNEWTTIKNNTNEWNDIYIDAPPDTIRRLYTEKGCNYIQISNGYGLYHLGTDPYQFDVPLFETPQQVRIRTKIHTRCDTQGNCKLSVTMACQPKNLKQLQVSKWSLDCISKLPPSLIYKQ